MTTKRWILGLGTLLLAAAGHVAWSYQPRARPAEPRDGSPVAALLADQSFPAAVWMPYPHQNMTHLRRIAGAGPASLRAIARLAGLPSPALPTFGPMALPPSSEIAAAADETGERFVVRAEVYPAFAFFAKLAGRLAGNPWLRGGEILVDGKQADVAWRGNLWTVASSGLSLEAPAREANDTPDRAGWSRTASGLAWIRIRQAADPLPAGLYRLWEDDSGIGITSQLEPTEPTAGSEAPALAERLEQLGLFLLVFSARHEALAEPAQALAFLDQEEARAMDLPRIVAIHEPGTEHWSLPGESLLEVAGRKPRTAQEGAWSITAIDSASLEQARRVAPELDVLSRSILAWGLWLDLSGGLAEVDRIARALANVPIAPRREVERWADARLVLTPLAERFSHLSAVVTDEPRAFALRLEQRVPEG